MNGSISAAKNTAMIVELVLDTAKEMEKVEGCDIYSVGMAPENHSKVYSYEVWENQEAYANALIMDVFRDLITEATPFITDVQYYPTF